MQIHRDGRFAVKFQGLPRRNSTLYLHLHFHLLALRAVFSLLSHYYLLGAAAFFPKLYELSVRSSQLLCWELTGQHPISNKACRSCSCLTPTHLRFHPRESPILSSCRNCISNFRRHASSYVFLRFKAGFFSLHERVFSIHHQLKEIYIEICVYLISLALLQLITLLFLFLFSLCLFNFYFADKLIFFHTKIYFLAAP